MTGFAALTLTLSALALVLGPGSPRASPLEALRAAQAALKPHIALDFWLDEDAGSPALLEAQWRATRAWTATWLDAHPHGSLTALAAAAKAETNLDLSAVRLDNDAVLVAANAESLGTVLILRRAAKGRFVTAMALDQPGIWGGGPTTLTAWRADHADSRCREHLADSAWDACGPMTGQLRRLPDEAGGGRRFAIVGNFAQAAGATGGSQLSVWRWRDGTARLLLTKTLTQMADDPVIAAVEPHALIVHEKGSYSHLFACGACSGRQIETTITLPAHGARVTATRSLTPELDWVADLLDRITDGRPTDDLAAPEVVTALKPPVSSVIDDQKRHGITPWVAMILAQKIQRRAGGETFCLDLDGLGAAQVFTLETRGAARYAPAVTTAPEGSCGDAG